MLPNKLAMKIPDVNLIHNRLHELRLDTDPALNLTIHTQEDPLLNPQSQQATKLTQLRDLPNDPRVTDRLPLPNNTANQPDHPPSINQNNVHIRLTDPWNHPFRPEKIPLVHMINSLPKEEATDPTIQ